MTSIEISMLNRERETSQNLDSSHHSPGLTCRIACRVAIFARMDPIHGHEVIQMMLQAQKPYTRASLLADIVANFGADARFYTCSAQDLTPEGLIDFLQSKGKFVSCEDGFQTSPDLMCKH
jgi:probable metal-binding protein